MSAASSGGVAFGLRDFWQRHPTGLEITGATGAAATVTLWLWSPQAQPMDLRHYSDKAHGLEIQYEDVEAGHSTPLGIARTNEIFLWPLATTPSRAALAAMAGHVAAPPCRSAPRLITRPAACSGPGARSIARPPSKAGCRTSSTGCGLLSERGRAAALVRVLGPRRRHAHL
jgi:hypothetical protein